LRRARRVWPARTATVAFQMLILLTGNYTFFNLLTMAIALWLLDDGHAQALAARGIARQGLAHATPRPARSQRTIVTAASGLLVVLSATQVYEVFRGTASEPFNSIADSPRSAPPHEPLRPLRGDDDDAARNRVRGK
jgi:hypothetical protein